MKKKIFLVIVFLCCIFIKTYIRDNLIADLGNMNRMQEDRANPFMYSLGYCPGYSSISCYSCACGQTGAQTCSYCTCCCHTHSYTSSYSNYSSTYHRAYCVCGVYQNQTHTTTTLACGYKYCNKVGCDRYISGSHKYTSSYSYVNTTNHYAYCACGDSLLETHTTTTLSCGYKYCIRTGCTYTSGNHSYTYASNGPSGHTGTCSCGDTKSGTHSLYNCCDIGQGCEICPYKSDGHTCHTHNYTYENTGSNEHYRNCVCGIHILEVHTLKMHCDAGNECSLCDYKDHETCEPHTCSYTAKYVSNSSSNHYAYCVCGTSKGTADSHTLIECCRLFITSNKICTDCGYKGHNCLTGNNYYLKTTVWPTGGGSVTGGGKKSAGASTTITATPATGYKFAKWITYNSSGDEFSILSDNTSSSQTFNMPSDSMTTLAIFSNKFTITFDSQGGSACSDKIIKYNTQYGTLQTPTRAGYTFNGWYNSGESLVTESTVMTTSSDHTLYAQWAPDIYTVIFDSQGGSACSSQSVTIDNVYGTLPTPIKSGYILEGWSTAIDGGVYVTKDTIVTIASDHTLYAKWSIIVNIPETVEGMVPVIYDGSDWIVTDTSDYRWYNYSDGRWANITLRDGLAVEGIADVMVATLQDMKGHKVTTTGSMYVWVPRYSYKISSGEIYIRWSDKTADDTTEGYMAHPAFNDALYKGGNTSKATNYSPELDDNNKLTGIWISKYESRNNSGRVKSTATGSRWTNISINSMYNYGKAIVETNLSTYGLEVPTGENVIFKSRMLKNSEWGAMVYLQNSATPYSEYGIKETSTGDEYTAIYQKLVGGTVNYRVRVNGANLITGDDSDADVIRLNKPFDNTTDNYERYSYYLGGAVIETSDISETTITSFGGITSTMPQGSTPLLKRIGDFGFASSNGAANISIGFRTSIIVKADR